MSISDLPVLAALRTKMQWHQERQRVLSENVANSDTPNFKPRDLVEPKFDGKGAAGGGIGGSLAMMRTSAAHIAPPGAADRLRGRTAMAVFETRPAGNAVNLEDEMLKVSANQMDYAAVTSLYSQSLHLSENRDRQGLSADSSEEETGDGGRRRRFRPLDGHRDVRPARAGRTACG